jgi:hypothetical protein
MAVAQLALTLRNAVNRAGEGEVVVSIHLFGIENARELQDVPLREVVDAAHLQKSYVTEIRKGMNLAKYVTVR